MIPRTFGLTPIVEASRAAAKPRLDVVVREQAEQLAYLVDNPSAWEGFDQTVSDQIKTAVAALRGALP